MIESDGILNQETLPLTGPIKVHRTTFQNGLRLLVIEDHTSPTFAYQTWYNVGSRDEMPGRTGLAHLFEHMMFKETKNLREGEFDRLLEGAGAEGENAFTNRDYTAYIQELPKDKLELIIKAEAERMVNLIITEKAFAMEREVVQNERRFRNENNPDGLMYQELFDLSFKKHPYHWPVIGYQKDLSAMTAEDALKFYHAHYNPNHATLAVIGDVDNEEVRSLVQKYYGEFQGAAASVHKISPEPLQTAPRQKKLKLNIQVQKLLVGYHIPAVQHEDIPALAVAQAVLTLGNSSRLHRSLVDSGISSSVDSDLLEEKDPSLFVISTNLQQKKSATEAEKVILTELDQLSAKALGQSELIRAKNKINFSFYQGLESNFQKAYFLGVYETIAGDFAAGVSLQKRINDVAAIDVQRVVKKYLNKKYRNVIFGVQK